MGLGVQVRASPPTSFSSLDSPVGSPRGRPAQGILGIEGKLPAPGSFGVKPPVALLAAHDARMSVACCVTYPFSRSVAPGSGRFVLPANDEAAVDITAGSLNADGLTEAGFGKRLASDEHNALFAADC